MKSMREIGYIEMAAFLHSLEEAGFTGDIIKRVVTSSGNRMAKDMYRSVGQFDNPFRFLKSFKIVVPEGHNYKTCLNTFREAHCLKGKNTYDENITDDKYMINTTTKLTVGQGFRVKAFRVMRPVTAEDFFIKIRQENAILLGVQGLIFAYEQCKVKLPKGKSIVSFDQKSALWQNKEGLYMLPYMKVHSGGAFNFFLGYFDGSWVDETILLCFCELPSVSQNEETIWDDPFS